MALQTTYTGRNITIPAAFKEHVESKLGKVDQLADKGQRLEVKVASENSHRRADTTITVELTVVGRGKVIRSEAQSEEKFAAFEIAWDKLCERLRRVRDKKKAKARSNGTLGHPAQSVGEALAGLTPVDPDRPLYEQVLDAEQADDLPPEQDDWDEPIRIRRKVFAAEPMSVDAAVDAMELLGHDFYLYLDAETGQPSAVYRRRGWTYGVISLDQNKRADEPETEELAYRPANGTTRSHVKAA
ncbi:ribosome hibernation-promoting factor, HPF/YfiA family [Nesterenkonia alkaliphila]|uniref:Ribosome hibernation promoting factor n=1 Tax=Nesterenkonia alkaliphila TaxID=1463631 RepID=A0A7K1UK77_9MICC|nr:ribosome-associated translation inhibitor RaiA [Nesterenkonia alkaliphila]MVT26895.1 ribosome-associated translation inhibitor RaiA [Nesterenkonia alkaliphila]GFZ82163.1 ribosomal subunit interface protein [Nesterenkonia alkaliphila]